MELVTCQDCRVSVWLEDSLEHDNRFHPLGGGIIDTFSDVDSGEDEYNTHSDVIEDDFGYFPVEEQIVKVSKQFIKHSTNNVTEIREELRKTNRIEETIFNGNNKRYSNVTNQFKTKLHFEKGYKNVLNDTSINNRVINTLGKMDIDKERKISDGKIESSEVITKEDSKANIGMVTCRYCKSCFDEGEALIKMKQSPCLSRTCELQQIEDDIDSEEYFYNLYKEATGDNYEIFNIEVLSDEDLNLLKEGNISPHKEACLQCHDDFYWADNHHSCVFTKHNKVVLGGHIMGGLDCLDNVENNDCSKCSPYNVAAEKNKNPKAKFFANPRWISQNN